MTHDVSWEPSGHWFVWTKKGRAPRFAHETRESAEREAERLARLHPGQKFHLMQSVGKAFAHTPIAPEMEAAAEAACHEVDAALSKAQPSI